MEIPGLLEDTLNLAGRAASARAPSAATTMADKTEAFRNAVAPASVTAEDFRVVQAEGFMAVEAAVAAVAVAGTGNRRFRNGEKPDAANEGQSY
jgi:hypothetical protein